MWSFHVLPWPSQQNSQHALLEVTFSWLERYISLEDNLIVFTEYFVALVTSSAGFPYRKRDSAEVGRPPHYSKPHGLVLASGKWVTRIPLKLLLEWMCTAGKVWFANEEVKRAELAAAYPASRLVPAAPALLLSLRLAALLCGAAAPPAACAEPALEDACLPRSAWAEAPLGARARASPAGSEGASLRGPPVASVISTWPAPSFSPPVASRLSPSHTSATVNKTANPARLIVVQVYKL